MRCVSTHLGLADDELDGPQNSDFFHAPGRRSEKCILLPAVWHSRGAIVVVTPETGEMDQVQLRSRKSVVNVEDQSQVCRHGNFDFDPQDIFSPSFGRPNPPGLHDCRTRNLSGGYVRVGKHRPTWPVSSFYHVETPPTRAPHVLLSFSTCSCQRELSGTRGSLSPTSTPPPLYRFE